MPATDFCVIGTEQCNICHGTGRVEHPWWTQYRAEHPDNGRIPDGVDFPPEEIPCTRCHGAGTIRTEIPLVEALLQLHVHPVDNARSPVAERMPEWRTS